MKATLIRIDGGTQPRVTLSEQAVDEFAEAMRDGHKFPELVVFHDGTDHWLADGFHRYHAYRKAEIDDIPVSIRPGTRRDAVLYSLGANSRHGLRRSIEDKRKAVQIALADEEWSQWSDRKIAAACDVSHPFVKSVREAMLRGGNVSTQGDGEAPKPKRKNGNVSTEGDGVVAPPDGNVSTPAPGNVSTPDPQEGHGADDPDPNDVIQALSEEVERLREENATLRMAAGEDRVKTVEHLKGHLAAVESQRNDLMDQVNALKRQVKALQRRLGE